MSWHPCFRVGSPQSPCRVTPCCPWQRPGERTCIPPLSDPCCLGPSSRLLLQSPPPALLPGKPNQDGPGGRGREMGPLSGCIWKGESTGFAEPGRGLRGTLRVGPEPLEERSRSGQRRGWGGEGEIVMSRLGVWESWCAGEPCRFEQFLNQRFPRGLGGNGAELGKV